MLKTCQDSLLNTVQIYSPHHPRYLGPEPGHCPLSPEPLQQPPIWPLPPAQVLQRSEGSLGTVTVPCPYVPAPDSPALATSPSHFKGVNFDSRSYFSLPVFAQAVSLPRMLFLLTNSYSSFETQLGITSSRRPS